jgi:adenosyl cobinamide kinase/adenosyl cobinamide phosphate guanylyltransferase
VVQAAARIFHEVASLSELQAGGTPAAGRRRRILVLGGARSGKSATAERIVASAPAVTYVATGPAPTPDDPEWTERVDLHRRRRPAHWTTVETRDVVGQLDSDSAEPVVIDCLATWLTSVLDQSGAWEQKPDAAETVAVAVDALVEHWRTTGRTAVAISNEVGSGVVPPTYAGRLFRDQLGLLNARLAAESDEVWLVTAGIAQRLR